jgi:flagellar motor switch protein FliM
MTRVSKRDANPTSLVQTRETGPEYPGIVPIGKAFGQGLSALVTGFQSREVTFAVEATRCMSLAEWRDAGPAATILCAMRMKPLKGQMVVVLPVPLIAQLVECHFGGHGEPSPARSQLTSAELNFVDRLGNSIAKILATSWASCTVLVPEYTGRIDASGMGVIAKDQDVVHVQSLSLSGDSFGPYQIDCLYPDTMLRPVGALSGSLTEEAVDVDPVWQAGLHQSVMQITLPLRTIFARTELPLAQLLSLQSGDMIPICLPNHVPVTIGGRAFANATVGESNGRTSIRIETLEEGFSAHV